MSALRKTRIVLFFALVGILAFALDRLIASGMRRIRMGNFGAYNRALYGGRKYQILISGSSRAVLHYDPRVLRAITGLDTFNIGRVGSMIDLQLALLKVILRHNPPPRLLIHNLDFHSFIRTHDNIFDPVQYAPYIDEPELYDAIGRIDPAVWRWRHVPLYRFLAHDPNLQWSQGARALLRHQPPESTTDGYSPRIESWGTAFARLKQTGQSMRYPIEPEALHDLEAIADMCKSRGIAAVFVFSPVYREFAEMAVNRSELMATFEKAAYLHGAQFLDYSLDPLSRDTANFSDHNHLNIRGAEKFSEALAYRLGRMYGL